MQEEIELQKQNLNQVRNENQKIKNENKVLKEKSGSSNETRIERKFELFRKEVTEQLTSVKKFVSEKVEERKEGKEEREDSRPISSSERTQERQCYVPNKINRGIDSCMLNSINRFAPLQFSANNPVTVNKDTDDDPVKPQVPGPRTYNDVVEKGSETLVFSTSITKGIRVREFNEYVEGNRTVSFRRFHGAKAHHIKEYLHVHLNETRPKSVIIQAGGNDLPTPKYNPISVSDIANEIVESGLLCKKFGVKTIYISSVLTRKPKFMQERCVELNNFLRELCKIHGFIFMENGNITTEHLQYDGVHLSNEGSIILANNYLFYLNDDNYCRDSH